MKSIYVGNLAYSTVEQDLESAFGTHGQVDRVYIVRDRDTGQARGFAFVEMANDDEADRAIKGLNGTDLQGRTLTVNEARPKPQGSGGFDRRPSGGGGNRGGGNRGGGNYGGGGGGGRRREPRW